MKTSLVIAGHEWRRLRVQAWPWLLLAAVLALLAWLFLDRLDTYLRLQESTGNAAHVGATAQVAAPVLGWLAILLIVLVPLLGSRAIAGERRVHSLNLLLAAGISDVAIVSGKWLGLCLWLLLLIALTALMPLSLFGTTELDLGRLAANLLALVLQAAMLAAIALYASSLTAQPVLAAAVALLINLLLCVVDLGAREAGVSNSLINWLALPSHFGPLSDGVVASVDLVWFALISGIFLALATRQLAALRGAD
ncbi:MAG: ABC transporter permease subunit [Rhodanobacteraceae bacterium]|nr:ABC transporter permease subunit [Rhodanobacteraceae bacterium]